MCSCRGLLAKSCRMATLSSATAMRMFARCSFLKPQVKAGLSFSSLNSVSLLSLCLLLCQMLGFYYPEDKSLESLMEAPDNHLYCPGLCAHKKRYEKSIMNVAHCKSGCVVMALDQNPQSRNSASCVSSDVDSWGYPFLFVGVLCDKM